MIALQVSEVIHDEKADELLTKKERKGVGKLFKRTLLLQWSSMDKSRGLFSSSLFPFNYNE